MTASLWNKKLEEVLRAFSADSGDCTIKSAQQQAMIEAANEIKRLQIRVTVLETVINEELDAYDCACNANRMIVESIRDRSRDAVGAPSK